MATTPEPTCFLAFVGEAAQVLEFDAGNRTRQQLDVAHVAHICAVALGSAAAHGELLLGVGQFALEFLAFVEQRGKARGHLFKRYFKFRSRYFNDLKLFVGGLARSISGERLQPAHARGDAAVR